MNILCLYETGTNLTGKNVELNLNLTSAKLAFLLKENSIGLMLQALPNKTSILASFALNFLNSNIAN